MFRKRFYVLMEEAGGEGGAAAGGAGEGEGAAGGEGGSGGSAIAGGAGDLPLHERIPEKFRVFDGEGEEAQFNLEGSASKLLESYTNLEKNRGEGTPETPDGYEIDAEAFGEDFKVDEFMADEGTQSFLKRMHAKGMSNAQVQEVLEYGLKEWAPTFAQGNVDLNQDQAIEHMKSEVWSDPAQYTENMGAANRAYMSLPEDMQNAVNERIGNDPTFLKVMALFGKEMAEDTSTTEETGLGDTADIEKLMLSEAYKDPKHPDHEKVSKQVRAFFEKKHPTKNT
jgi:hypothetical protein